MQYYSESEECVQMWTLPFETSNFSASVYRAHSMSTEPPSLGLETGHSVHVGARSHTALTAPSLYPRIPTLPQSTRPSMDVLSATSAMVGLAIPVFQCA